MSAFVRIASIALLSAACVSEAPPATGGDAAPAAAAGPVDRVALAMSGAPSAVSAAATIMDFDADGKLVELRAGTNGWLCVPDENPAAPGDAPMCMDGAWQQWFAAYEQRATPALTGVGVSYMLQGGPAASNTDPFATEPPPGQDWIQDGPHVMIIVPDPAMLDAFSTDPASGGPYVMWKGTPYAHLMVPVSGN